MFCGFWWFFNDLGLAVVMVYAVICRVLIWVLFGFMGTMHLNTLVVWGLEKWWNYITFLFLWILDYETKQFF